MLPAERQYQIKTLLTNNKTMKISDLSSKLGVSDMTIHRDLKPLINDGFIIKTFGGVTLNEVTVQTNKDPVTCVICHREYDDRLAYRLISANDKIEIACCAHCGLIRHRQIAENVIQAMCHDFLTQTTISAPSAWYVMNTSINIGCCQPQVLTFELKEQALKFIKGFGGNVYQFNEAIEVVHEQMNCNSCQQSK